MINAQCTEACASMPQCTTCHRHKAPRGRSVPLESSSGYCDDDCLGYNEAPLPGHLWPEEWREHAAQGGTVSP